jgi:hypothetical protein
VAKAAERATRAENLMDEVPDRAALLKDLELITNAGRAAPLRRWFGR